MTAFEPLRTSIICPSTESPDIAKKKSNILTEIEVSSWPALISFHFAPALFEGQRRSNSNFICTNIVGLDFDNCCATPELLLKAYESLDAVIYTTRSHTPEHPRLRAIFRLDSPITDAYTLVATLADLDIYAAVELLAAGVTTTHGEGFDCVADPAATDLARFFFGLPPGGQYWLTGGTQRVVPNCTEKSAHFVKKITNKPPTPPAAFFSKNADTFTPPAESPTLLTIVHEYTQADVDANSKRMLQNENKRQPFIEPGLLDLTPGMLVLFGAVSGTGKTMFTLMAAATAISNGKKVLFFTNEESGEILISRIQYYLLKFGCNKDAWRPLLKMRDVYNTGAGLTDADRVAGIILNEIEAHTPDVVFFDHLNLAKKSFSNPRLAPFDSLPMIVHTLSARVYDKTKPSLPPIVLTCQTKPVRVKDIAHTEMSEITKNSTSMLNFCTHGMYLVRDRENDITYTVVAKQREGMKRTSGSYKWQWKMQDGYLQPFVGGEEV